MDNDTLDNGKKKKKAKGKNKSKKSKHDSSDDVHEVIVHFQNDLMHGDRYGYE